MASFVELHMEGLEGIIDEFNKNELQFLANSMWLSDSIMSGLFVMITISQIDIAILRIVYSNICSLFTIRMLLNEKTFIDNNNDIITSNSLINYIIHTSNNIIQYVNNLDATIQYISHTSNDLINYVNNTSNTIINM